jgi:hypothetical protein
LEERMRVRMEQAYGLMDKSMDSSAREPGILAPLLKICVALGKLLISLHISFFICEWRY